MRDVRKLVVGLFILTGAWIFGGARAADQTPCDVTMQDLRAVVPGCQSAWLNANLALNEIQTVGTAESYKLAPTGPLLSLIRMGSEDDVKALNYSEPPLVEQLDAGARSFQFDVAFDPKGGLFKYPAGASMAGDLVPDDYIAAMSSPGFKVIHILDIDFKSTCVTLEDCLRQLEVWSRAHPNHLPITIFLKSNDERTPMPGATRPSKFDKPVFDALDQLLRSIFKPEELITPDDVQASSPTLRAAVLDHRWPRLGAAHGKFIFVLDDTPAKVTLYRGGRSNLEGRVMFVATDEASPVAAFLSVENPAKDAAAVKKYVQAGYIVHTFADAEAREARANAVSRRDWAFATGAQIISTDFLKPDPQIGTYSVHLPQGRVAQCNIVATAKICGDVDVEAAASP